MKRCHKCDAEWAGEKRVPGFKEYCENCSAYLHCCLNCRFHDPAYHNQCQIPNTDWVGNKSGLNFCDEFEFADTDATRSNRTGEEKGKKDFSALFGDSETDIPKTPGLDDLFGD